MTEQAPPEATPAISVAPAPVDLDARAAQMAISIVEGHYEASTGSHMHWLYRELSTHMHRAALLAAREEQVTRSNTRRRRARGGQNS